MQKQLKRILKLVPLLQTHHSDFPPNGLQIFTLVALNEGISSTELVEKLDAPKATVSRNLRMLGDRMSPTRDGMGLVSLRHDPKDYRVRRAYITEKGQVFLDELLEALD